MIKEWILGLLIAVSCMTGVRGQDEKGCQVPIAPYHRTYNRSGQQCVYASLETLGRHWNESRLMGLTKDPAFQGEANYLLVSRLLQDRGIRNVVLHPNPMIKYDSYLEVLMKQHAGVVFGIKVPRTIRLVIIDPLDGQVRQYDFCRWVGHAMTLVHYDAKKDIVKFIDNADPKLKVQTWTTEEFHRRWDGMAIIIR